MKKKIAVVMGGYSSEFEISLGSGNYVYQQLNRDKYDVYRVQIRKGAWEVILDSGDKFAVEKNDFSVNIEGEKIKFDCVFNMIHGTPGEDGLLQAYFELLDIPQTSSGFYASALSFHKFDCNAVLNTYGIKTAKNYFLVRGDAVDEKEILNRVGLPCFVKANRSGSSYGVTKVKEQSELSAAIEHAFEEGDEVLIESFLDGVEVDVGVIEYKDEVRALPTTEIVTENEFFDYNAKYLGESQEITPARISDADTLKVQELSIKVFKALNLKGFARAEYIFHEGEPHFIEINTVPGMTAASIVPQQLNAAGIDHSEFFTGLVENALKNSK